MLNQNGTSNGERDEKSEGVFEKRISSTRNLYDVELLHSMEDSDKLPSYADEYMKSIRNPEAFWAEQAKQLVWTKPWTKVLDNSNPPFTKWFVGGELNVCYNAVDRHVIANKGEHIALIHDSPIPRTVTRLTYNQLLDQVSRAAGVLASHGVNSGDSVLLYVPLIPEGIVAMLSTVRIGAIHSVVFGGYAAHELRARIENSEPKVIITASCGLEPNKVIRYKDILDEALAECSHKPNAVLIVQRTNIFEAELSNERDVDWHKALSKAKPHPAVPVEANHPLYILYTSGTTSLPKGVQRSCGGHAVALHWTMKTVYSISHPEVWWAASDLGWVVGHSYICYAPLLAGCTSILYEGKPDRTPDPEQYFRVIAQHNVSVLFTIPTALRVLRRADPMAHGTISYPQIYRSLKRIFLAGEHCDPEGLAWAERIFKVPVLNHWWQTETGSAITAPCTGYRGAAPLQHNKLSVGVPVPGYDIHILRSDGGQAKPGEVGQIVIKLPLPPGNAVTLWRANRRFVETYFTKYPGYYNTMDSGYIDSTGRVWVLTRTDDIINVAGHRLSTAALEAVVLRHPRIVDAAVFGGPDRIKGDVPVCLYVLDRKGDLNDEIVINKELVSLVRERVGPVTSFHHAASVAALPRTRSGKTMRSLLRKIARGELLTPSVKAVVADPSTIDEAVSALERIGFEYAVLLE